MARLLSTLLMVSTILFTLALPAGAAPRPIAPVQDGFVSDADFQSPYATDHLLVQFTEAAYLKSNLQMAKALNDAVPSARAGLKGVDLIMDEAGVSRVSRVFAGPRNKSAADAQGVHRWYRVDVPDGADIEALAARFAADPDVEIALPDLRAFYTAVPNDPLHTNHWGHNNTAQLPTFDWGGTWEHTGAPVGTLGFDAKAEAAWSGAQGYGTTGVVIAILDSGVDSTHPDLNQVTGYDFGDDDADPNDDSADPGHGTACAGVAAAIADNALGSAGAAGGCSIMPLKCADSAGALLFSYIINAVYYAADNGADVISMSFGAAATSYAPMDAALTYAKNAGAISLAATGNENDSTISYPAYNPDVVGVGAASPCGDRKRSSSSTGEVNPGVATDPNGYTCDGERWWGSNYGLNTQDAGGAVDILGPTILPTTDIQGSGGYDPGNYSDFFNGTSCATPYVAGVAALVMSANPTWTPDQVWSQLMATAEDVQNVEAGAGWDRYSGYGMVNAAGAVGVTGTPPTANFSTDVTAGCLPLDVNFTDQSTGTVTSWLWNFGDGNTATAQNPMHTYSVAGTYTVTLTVSGADGSDDIIQTDLIYADGAPAVGFTASVTSGLAPLSVDFSDTSSGYVTSWSWFLGDGNSSTDQNPSHTYFLPGTYFVQLTVDGPCGSDVEMKLGYIEVYGPVTADFTADVTTGCSPLTVNFTDTSAGSPTTWLWDFGDGQTDTLQNPTHVFSGPGPYDVTLTATGPGGSDDEAKASFISLTPGTTAAFSASDSSGIAPLSVTFTDASVNATGWTWDFGDGGTDLVQNPVHEYTTAGVYTVTLIATGDCEPDTLVLTDLITVTTPSAPVTAFSATPVSGCGPLEVTFTDETTGDVTSWLWNFGDGTTSAVQNPVHSYGAPGLYTVTLLATGPGGSTPLAKTDYISVGEVPVAGFTLDDDSGANPHTVTFADVSTGGVTNWAWDFGDGATDTLASPVHTYTVSGTYSVSLIVSNACGADTLTLADAIYVGSPSDTPDGLPRTFALNRNYPNPFNPMTSIEFTLTREGHTVLEIFDATGRRQDTLINEVRGPGLHTIQWAPQGLPSGVFFARLTANGQTATRRMVLLK